ncbi:hypothetical protein HMPREF2975_10715 [Actinomyces sp. HMSC065F12]|nr:hypothetical protein HMPREF2975_10715 [Actinomyces sp. HMSC065F12]
MMTKILPQLSELAWKTMSVALGVFVTSGMGMKIQNQWLIVLCTWGIISRLVVITAEFHLMPKICHQDMGCIDGIFWIL